MAVRPPEVDPVKGQRRRAPGIADEIVIGQPRGTAAAAHAFPLTVPVLELETR
jgi:hypothetical protein